MSGAALHEREYLAGLGRAAAGALLFGFPLLMTMEMWAFGLHMDRLRMALFVAVTAAVVLGLSRFSGFRDDTTFADDVLDTLASLLVGIVVSAAMLWMMAIVTPQDTPRMIFGMIAVQAAPAAMGAILANRQLQQRDGDAEKEDRAGYLGQLFLMTAGALFIAFNVAPTEEMILIGFKMTPWHALAMVFASVALLHVLVFTVGFAGQHEHDSAAKAFAQFTLPGYAIALLVSAYVLWTFGRLDGGVSEAMRAIAVLSFPAALGAALARLVV